MYECHYNALITHIVLVFKLLVLNGLLISMTFSSTLNSALCVRCVANNLLAGTTVNEAIKFAMPPSSVMI